MRWSYSFTKKSVKSTLISTKISYPEKFIYSLINAWDHNYLQHRDEWIKNYKMDRPSNCLDNVD